MPNSINNSMRNKMLDGGVRDAVNGGVLEIRSGSIPGSADSTASGTLLVSIPIPADGFGTPTDGSMSIGDEFSEDAETDGTAGWARLIGSDDSRIDFSVGGEGSGSDIIITNNIEGVSDTEIVQGNPVTVTEGTINVA